MRNAERICNPARVVDVLAGAAAALAAGGGAMIVKLQGDADDVVTRLPSSARRRRRNRRRPTWPRRRASLLPDGCHILLRRWSSERLWRFQGLEGFSTSACRTRDMGIDIGRNWFRFNRLLRVKCHSMLTAWRRATGYYSENYAASKAVASRRNLNVARFSLIQLSTGPAHQSRTRLKT